MELLSEDSLFLSPQKVARPERSRKSDSKVSVLSFLRGKENQKQLRTTASSSGSAFPSFDFNTV
jgi:hypothetical protein